MLHDERLGSQEDRDAAARWAGANLTIGLVVPRSSRTGITNSPSFPKVAATSPA